MRKYIDVFCDMSSLAEAMCNMRERACPEYAAAVREMNRLRGELCRVKGVAEQDISADGYDISQRAYESVRDRWIEEISSPFADDWHLAGARRAHARWVGHRPDLAEADDWFAGAAKPDDDTPRGN